MSTLANSANLALGYFLVEDFDLIFCDFLDIVQRIKSCYCLKPSTQILPGGCRLTGCGRWGEGATAQILGKVFGQRDLVME